MEEKESETRGRSGWDGAATPPPASSELPARLTTSESLSGSPSLIPGLGLSPPVVGLPDWGRPLGLPAGLVPSPHSSSGKAEVRRAGPEHFRAAMTSVFVPKINAPQTRHCGQGLRSYCKYQPWASYFCFTDSLGGRHWPAPLQCSLFCLLHPGKRLGLDLPQ